MSEVTGVMRSPVRGIRLGRTVRRALATADVLDNVVAAQLPTVSALPDQARDRGVEYLAELVMLGQSYRYYAHGWISRRALHKRGRATLGRLAELRRARQAAVQLTDQD